MISRALIGLGILLFGIGVFLEWGGSVFPLGRLPGDLAIERPGVSFYFPVMSCLIISSLLSLLSYIFRKL